MISAIIIFLIGCSAIYLGFQIALIRKHFEMHKKWSDAKLRSYGLNPKERKYRAK